MATRPRAVAPWSKTRHIGLRPGQSGRKPPARAKGWRATDHATRSIREATWEKPSQAAAGSILPVSKCSRSPRAHSASG